MKKKFNDIALQRFLLAQDESLSNYIPNFKKRSVSGLMLRDISGFVKRFGQVHEDMFGELKTKNKNTCHMYNSIVIDRHNAAHGSGSSETISGVRKLYDMGHIVLDLFEEALWVN